MGPHALIIDNPSNQRRVSDSSARWSRPGPVLKKLSNFGRWLDMMHEICMKSHP